VRRPGVLHHEDMPHAAFATSILTDYFTRRRDNRPVRASLECRGEPVPFVPPPTQRRRLRLRVRRPVRIAV
jgi:hypothetical protein